MSNIDCENCEDCKYCEQCKCCCNCRNCINCYGLVGELDCENVISYEDEYYIGKFNATKLTKEIIEQMIKDEVVCITFDCEDCYNYEDYYNCNDCNDCTKCDDCENCNDCEKCNDCENCTNCYNLFGESDKENLILYNDEYYTGNFNAKDLTKEIIERMIKDKIVYIILD